ncbi:TPA_asm: hypothetical protein G3V02_003430 [Salmonella enterica subsp. enterica serovar Ank]|uniref:Uncharacterized protein n=1 Tax=Salmonella enterica subsp. enterica serovar Ank TaxID=1173578 RepID=A0A727BZ35_SALET|nr:hypothetical protein [Salmonella enterica subsp. enterica serovar Ank]
MNEQGIKRLLIVSVILNVIVIFLFVQALSRNITQKKDVGKVTNNVPIISPLCEYKKEKHYKHSYGDDGYWKEFFGDPDNGIENNTTPCYWVNPITKKYFKFDKNIIIMKGENNGLGGSYYIHKFAYINTPYIYLLDLPNFSGVSMEEVKQEILDIYKIRLVTKGDYIKRDDFEEWVGSGFSLNKDGSDGVFVIFALIKKDNKFWTIYSYYSSEYKSYDDKRTMTLIDEIIETL